MFTPAPHANYWIEELGAFHHGRPLFPNVLSSAPAADASARVHYRLAADGSVSLEVLGCAAMVLVASRYNGGERVVIATPATGPGEGVTCVLPGPWHEQEQVRDFLARIGEALAAARRHEPCPLDGVAAGLGLDAEGLSRACLQLAYAHGAAAAPAVLRERAGLLVRVEAAAVEVHARGGVCPPVLAQQVAAHVARAAAWLAAHGDRRLADCELLAPEERRQVGQTFNDTAVAVPPGLTLHGLIAAQAGRTPDAIAVVHGETALTYRAFDRRSNHLAAILRRDFRVSTGACVGVMMDRSEHAIVAMTGVMKAGAAYVPINPRHPWETVRYMIENAGISVLIVDSESIAAASNFSGDLLVIDIEMRGAPEADAPAPAAAGGDLAYVIYTSGSTGRPKGVAVEHRAVVNTILWRNAFYGIGPSDINLQIPSFSFDSSVVDIFCVLTAGGTLVVPDEDMRLDARRLLEVSVARRVTSCIVTPSYYRLLLTELAGAVPSLRWVTLAGESATPELVAAHLATLPGVGLYNEYGPTENAVCSTACRIERAEPTVSIGRPIWNVTVLIVDAAGRLVPIGVPGEVLLGGAGLARGYLHQDDLTAERFIASPVPDVFSGRVYRTGDRACWRPDGALEFLGRIDNQVKIRGVRIELDEVEQALLRHPDVKHGAVVCREDAAGVKYLAAYVEAPAGVTRTALRDHMAGQLPAYMIPDTFVVLPSLPLNLNGKVDRVALADIPDQAAGAEMVHTPLSPVQSHLLALWADVLNRSQVALDDNFFTMGGNSLRVMELTTRIRGELVPGVELLDIYTYPTARELADHLEDISQQGLSRSQ